MARDAFVQYTSVQGFIFNKLVAGAVLKRDIAESDGNGLLDAGRGIEVAILKQSLETERFFTGNG